MERKSVKIILLNEENELALVCIDDAKITDISGKYQGRFWNMIGGKIEEGETLLEAAKRELFEETGIKSHDVKFGPEVWYGTVDLLLDGKLTTINQRFVVAKTSVRSFDFSNQEENEKLTVKTIEWFSLEDIKTCGEPIYPISLASHLPAIIGGNYPKVPLQIVL
ncbi:MAG: NUDIX domain-containing protein [Puniceicoccales bacterium]|jgi:8-oxo-dGTP pyrophosphatase MutT (NUDIX family)|nr:NUDIX domain-containing protein [Puniceicoccales bacterium]